LFYHILSDISGSTVPGHHNFICPIAMISDFECRTSGNLEICNISFSVLQRIQMWGDIFSKP